MAFIWYHAELSNFKIQRTIMLQLIGMRHQKPNN